MKRLSLFDRYVTPLCLNYSVQNVQLVNNCSSRIYSISYSQVRFICGEDFKAFHFFIIKLVRVLWAWNVFRFMGNLHSPLFFRVFTPVINLKFGGFGFGTLNQMIFVSSLRKDLSIGFHLSIIYHVSVHQICAPDLIQHVEWSQFQIEILKIQSGIVLYHEIFQLKWICISKEFYLGWSLWHLESN